MKRQVYVIEGRRKGAKLWRVQQAYWNRRKACEEMRVYRDGRNPYGEFRITTYVPKETK